MLWIILAILIILVLFVILLFVIFAYNKLVTLRQRTKNSFSQMDVQLQRRFDLIPNLVETVKGYITHESETLTKIVELRTSWANAKTIDEKAKLDNELAGTLKTIMAVSESYPDLKASQNFTNLQSELSETEDKISYSRQFYNDSVTKYNTELEKFPSNIIASMFHFTPENLFEVDNQDARKNVKVDFNK